MEGGGISPPRVISCVVLGSNLCAFAKIYSEIHTNQQHTLNQRALRSLNLHDNPRSPAPFTPPGIATSREKSKKRSVAEHGEPRPQSNYKSRKGALTPEGYSRDNASVGGQREGGFQPTPSHQTRSNDQHSMLPALQPDSLYDFNFPVNSETRTRPPQQNHVDSGRPAPKLTIVPPKRLFPPGEWLPIQQSISAEMEELLQMRAVTFANNAYDSEPPPLSPMVREPPTLQMSRQQLIEEVERIYSKLIYAEKQCNIEKQSIADPKGLTSEQWTLLINRHRILLHLHHDFYTSSQHPKACKEILGFATGRNVPPRLWGIGIFPLLHTMWAGLPNCVDRMLEFIHHAYNIMILLMETVPRFKNTWAEVLGDLSRYRMSIEVSSVGEKNVWARIAKYWYDQGLDYNYGIGRLHHRLGLIAKPNLSRQLFCYTKSLVSIEPYEYSTTSIQPAFKAALATVGHASAPLNTTLPLSPFFVSAHAMLFCGGPIVTFVVYAKEFLTLLDTEISRLGPKFLESGICLGNSNVAAMLQYGDKDGIIGRMFIDSQMLSLSLKDRMLRAKQYWANSSTETSRMPLQDEISSNATLLSTSFQKLSYSTYLTFQTLSSVLLHTHNIHIAPYVHLSLAFIWSLALVPDSMAYVEGEIPWGKIASYLNTLLRGLISESNLESANFPISEDKDIQQFPEDFEIRGQIWSQLTYPPDFFKGARVDDERVWELPSIGHARTERCIWYGYRLASVRFPCLFAFIHFYFHGLIVFHFDLLFLFYLLTNCFLVWPLD